ncbi:MAG: hypothetical protein V4735_06020 [Pseudomonadota bacterium]
MHGSLAQMRQEILVNGLVDNSHEWMVCDWQALCAQLLQQWNRLSASDLEDVGPSRRELAALVQRKYDIALPLVENYLANLERTLPLIQNEPTYRFA